MRNFLYLILTIAIVSITASCSKNDDATPTNPTTNLVKVGTQTQGDFTINMYTTDGRLVASKANYIIVEMIDNSNVNNTSFTDATWTPTMHMTMSNGHEMSHSTPATILSKLEGTSNKFKGEIMFSMAGNEPNKNYWTVDVIAKNNNVEIKATVNLLVDQFDPKKDLKTLDSFRVGDPQTGELYWIALHKIQNVKVGKNPIQVSIYRKEDNGNSFPIADEFSVEIDPRMPTMGNHGVGEILAPLKQNQIGGSYNGIISFNMGGYWLINLLIKDKNGEVVAGQFVEPSSKVNSDKYFEVEF